MISRKLSRLFSSHVSKINNNNIYPPGICYGASMRGIRSANEDRIMLAATKLGGRNSLMVGVFDGHGGSAASEYCADNIQKSFVECFEGEVSKRKHVDVKSLQSLAETSIKHAFMNMDKAFIQQFPVESEQSGSTGSVAVIQELLDVHNKPANIVTIGHIGDTRIIACDNITGKAKVLTVDHTASRQSERQRIEKSGGYISSDSFGQQAVMGALAVTRAFGVRKFKKDPSIITAEPFVQTITSDSKQSFLVLVSDGITSVMSDQEIVDIVKHCINPKVAVNTILEIAEQYSTKDNYSAIVVRLPGWIVDHKPPHTKDYTQNIRRYKLKHSDFGSRLSDELDNADTRSSDQMNEVAHDRFIIDLFDVVGKDIGKSDVIDKYSSVNDTLSKFAFRDGGMQVSSKIGRLNFDEFMAAVADLNVKILDSKTNQHVDVEKLAYEIFTSVGSMKDIEQSSTMIRFDGASDKRTSDHHVEIQLAHTKSHPAITANALSAADIIRALKKLKYRILR